MSKNVDTAARLRAAIALAGIGAVCWLAYCVGSGWALPGLFGIGFIVDKVRGEDNYDDMEGG